MRLPSSANHSMKEAGVGDLAARLGERLSCSEVISTARSSWFSSSSSNQRRRSFERAGGHRPPCRPGGVGTAIARRVSSRLIFGTVPSTAPVAGLVTSMVAVESASTHSPSM